MSVKKDAQRALTKVRCKGELRYQDKYDLARKLGMTPDEAEAAEAYLLAKGLANVRTDKEHNQKVLTERKKVRVG